jgi:hypothetical protein
LSRDPSVSATALIATPGILGRRMVPTPRVTTSDVGYGSRLKAGTTCGEISA